jgi:hypothetical protein
MISAFPLKPTWLWHLLSKDLDVISKVLLIKDIKVASTRRGIETFVWCFKLSEANSIQMETQWFQNASEISIRCSILRNSCQEITELISIGW